MNKKYDSLSEYRNAVLSEEITPKEIMGEITLPEYVYKYRKFDERYLTASLDGEVFFSMPSDMNVNDDCDCKLKFSNGKVLEGAGLLRINPNSKLDPKIKNLLEDYKSYLQTKLRIACFTTCDCCNASMWDNQYFGDNHTGYCVKYKVDPEYFYPKTIVFLKILYDDIGFDATNAIINFGKFSKLNPKDDRFQEVAKKLVCLGYNHTLFKSEKYRDEMEWRIIIPENRFEEYFPQKFYDNTVNPVKNFSPLMEAIYLGSSFKEADKKGEMYEYAKSACKRNNIPLYSMKLHNNKLEETVEYNPGQFE